jgi:TonB family protein
MPPVLTVPQGGNMNKLIVGGLISGLCLWGIGQTEESDASRVVSLPETVVSESMDTVTLKPIAPAYPREMAVQCITGYVVADLTVDDRGRVIRVDIPQSSRRAFAEVAEEALWKWEFVPSESEKRHFVVPIRFGLPGVPDATRPESRSEIVVMATLESQVVSSVMPQYPPELCRHLKSGEVMLEASVDQKGQVKKVTVLQADDPLFADAAEEALRQWTFVASEQPLPGGERQVRVPMKFMLAGR